MKKENLIGNKFVDGLREYEIYDFINIGAKEFYRVKNHTENRTSEIFTPEQIEKYLLNQFELCCKYYRGINRSKEMELRAIAEEKKEQEEKNKYNFCYGFVDNKSDMQKGKILKSLNQLVRYDGIVYTKKDWIEFLITNKEIIKVEEFFNTERYSKRKNNEKLKDKIEYTIWYKDKIHEKLGNDLNKTEYQYALYLVEKLNIKLTA